jgi:hypothetical protein
MASNRVVPELEGPLHSIGSEIINRIRFAARGLVSGKAPGSNADDTPDAKDRDTPELLDDKTDAVNGQDAKKRRSKGKSP